MVLFCRRFPLNELAEVQRTSGEQAKIDKNGKIS